MQSERLSKISLVVLVGGITLLFLNMTRPFLMTILLAAIFAALSQPLYQRLVGMLRGHRALAAIVTLLLLVAFVIIPFMLFLSIVVGQALSIAAAITPWVQQQIAEPDQFIRAIEDTAIYERLAPFREEIVTKAGNLVGGITKFLINSLSSMTMGTAAFLFQFFVLLYAMFWFLIDGKSLLRKILYYLPLDDTDERRVLEKFTSVTRATIKGTLLIGVTQGGLAGLAFYVIGIPSSVFWAALMAVLSIIPGIGTGLVWIPAAIILVAGGHVAKGIGLALFCALIVGSIDNLMRPWLVGRDTQMHDLLIFLGSLGGILLFGAVGFIIGPIVAALFVTVWDIYGTVFKEVLPQVSWLGPDPAEDQRESPE